MLIAEDDPRQAELVRRYAAAAGHETFVAPNGHAAVERLRADPPDLLVLDVMMPVLDGLDVLRIVRADDAHWSLPVLVLTARSQEHDLLDGFELGADDYLTKPYSPRELMARVGALLRRGARGTEPERLVAGALTIDLGSREVVFRGATVECTPGEFTLLALLAGAPGRVYARGQILRHLHGTDQWVSPRTVDVHVANLRKKLAPELVATVYGVGYRLAVIG
ncbi:MAG: response regulator transcription factor [Actinomycetales bacterium]|nr:response regulator transcription factor [Actinomycetales bacterium]